MVLYAQNRSCLINQESKKLATRFLRAMKMNNENTVLRLGRKPKERKPGRTIRKIIRLTPQEEKDLMAAAANYMSVSDYIRSMVFNSGKAVVNPKEFLEKYDRIVGEINRVGTNINQIANYTNYLKSSGNTDPVVLNQFSSDMGEFNSLLRELAFVFRKMI